MTNVIQNVYPKDLTMSLASNHIEREKKLFTGAEDRIFVPDGGPFFSQSLIIKDSNGRDLKPQLDYKLLYLNEGATLEAGRDIVSVIWVLKETISSVSLDYRVVGGDYGNTVNAIMQEITKAGPIQKNVDWNVNVYGKPHQFPPAPHFHTPDTFTGWQMVYEQLEGIRKAIIAGDDVSWEAHYNYINRLMNGLETNLNSKLSGYATHSQVSNALSSVEVDVDLSNYYTKAQADSAIKIATDEVSNVSETLVNYYTKTQSDNRYPLKTDNYTKTESDGKYALKIDYYTKGQSDSKYLTSVNLNGYFTTVSAGQMETRLNQRIDTVIGGTQDVDLSNYYTKGQVYARSETYSRTETYTRLEVDNKLSTITQNVTNLTNSITNFVPKYRIVSIADNYTVTSADLKGDTIIRSTRAGDCRITIPAIGANMVVGHVISIRQVPATGNVTIVGASGVTINPNDSLVLRRAGSTATLVYVANNTFDLITELS